MPHTATSEAERLAALHRHRLLDTPAEDAFDSLARLAAQVCETPTALVSLVDETRQWFKARVNWDSEETPRAISLCGTTIQEPDLLVVPDALADARFADNPLARSGQVRFYAGMPLVDSDGFGLGALCVLDIVPRDLTPVQRQALRTLGRQAVREIEQRRRLQELEDRRPQRAAQKLEGGPLLSVSRRIAGDKTLLSINGGIERMTGYTPEEYLADPDLALRIVHPDDRALFEAMLDNPAAFEEPVTLRWLHRDGHTVWFERTSRLVHDEHGRAIVESSSRAVAAPVEEEPDGERILNAQWVSVVSVDGKLSYVSPSVAGVLGWKPEDLVGTSAFEHVHPEDLATLRKRLQNSTSTAGGSIAYRYRDASGRYRDCAGTAWVMREAGLVILHSHDRAAIRQAETEARAARRSLSELTRSRSRLVNGLTQMQKQKELFAALVVHDLKNPIAALLANLDLLLTEPDVSEDTLASGRQMKMAVDRMHRLVLDLLDISRSEDGALSARLAELDLAALIAEVAEPYRARAQGRRQEIVLLLAPDAVRAVADADLLRRTLENLLDNALKYSRAGTRIEVQLSRLGGAVELRVVNEGAPIAEADRARVFEKYAQCEPAQNRTSRGLGLVFCRIAVEAQGGTIAAEDVKSGASFCLRLPQPSVK